MQNSCGSHLPMRPRGLASQLSDRASGLPAQAGGQAGRKAAWAIGNAQGAAAALRDGLYDGQAQSATAALAVSPEALGEELHVLIGDAGAMVTHGKIDSVVDVFYLQFDGCAWRGMAHRVL